MFGPKLETANGTLLFDSTGVLAVVTNDQPRPRGHWRSSVDPGAPKANAFHYDLDGAEQLPVAVQYSFNDDNQLLAQLTAPEGSTSQPFAFCGGIEIDDNHDLLYRLIDEQGNPTGAAISVYGDLKFQERTEDLVISTIGGADAVIHRIQGEKSLDALENDVAFQPKDLLRFQAVTFNTFPGSEDGVPVRAVIDFVGQWDLQNNQLVFLSRIKADLSHPAVNLVLAGQIGAVKTGFEYKSGEDGTQLLFTIEGKHKINSANAATTVEWSSRVGFSAKEFRARLTGGSVTNFASGRKLTLDGDFELVRKEDSAAGAAGTTAAKMTLSLGARYEWENNVLVFKADISEENNQLNYNLELGGTWNYSDRTLTFRIRYTDDPRQPDLHIELGLTADRGSLMRMISLVLDITEGEAEAKIDASFEIRLQWANGVPVKSIETGAGE